VHEIIPLLRARGLAGLKLIRRAELALRFRSEGKAPTKEAERMLLSASRLAGRERDPLAGIRISKFTPRVRRAAKLRLFRVWKLFQEKSAPA
jgi:hypothetical protein